MKILVVCQYYYPENFQVTPICEQLAADGYDVTVLTGLPNYSTGKVPREYKKKSHKKEKINGVKVIRCNEIGRKKGAVRLVLNYLSFYFSAMKMIKKMSNGFDLVFTYQLSPILMGLPSKWYTEKYKKPHLLYCCDLWPESVKVYLKNDNSQVFRYIKEISRQVYCSADKLIIQSKSFADYLMKTHHIEEEKLVYIPAFASEAYLHADFTPENNGVIDYVFMGNIGIAQDLSTLLEAFYNAVKRIDKLRLHIVGEGVCLEQLKRDVQKYGIGEKVIFYGHRPVEEMVIFYKLADACLVSLKADNAIGLTLPAKVQGYMAAGKPIIGMINGSAQDVIRESQCGICVDAGNRRGLEDAFCDFAENPEKYGTCGERGREYFKKHFRKDIFMRALENQIGLTGRR